MDPTVQAVSLKDDTVTPPPESEHRNTVSSSNTKNRTNSKPKQKVKSKESIKSGTHRIRPWHDLGKGFFSTGKLCLSRSFLRNRFLHLVGTASFLLLVCGVMFLFQAYLAFRSYKMMNQLQRRPPMPEMIYRLYFEGHDWALNVDRVDLRANTSIFMH